MLELAGAGLTMLGFFETQLEPFVSSRLPSRILELLGADRVFRRDGREVSAVLPRWWTGCPVFDSWSVLSELRVRTFCGLKTSVHITWAPR